MLIRDIISEGYTGELLDAVKRLMVSLMSDDIKEIPTKKFTKLLAQQGYILSTEEVIAAVDRTGFASSVDSETIIPNTELPADVDTSPEATVDVGAMAGDQAMTDINAELPQ